MNNKEKQIDKSSLGLLIVFITLAGLYGVLFTRWTVIAFQEFPFMSWFTLIVNQILFIMFTFIVKELWDTRYKKS